MFINKDAIRINGVSMGNYLTSASYQYNKLWGDDTGRALSGAYQGTLKGIFPKFELSFRPLTQAEVEYLVPIFDSDFQTFTYYDPLKKQTISIQTYSGDYELLMENMRKTKPFKISFIATRKRS